VCIVFLASQGDTVLVGNNEDYVYPKTRVWYLPAAGGEIGGDSFEAGQYARVYYGYEGFPPQSGMNEAGLCFAITSTPPLEIKSALGKPKYEGNLIDRAMAECATVDQALDLMARYYLRGLERACLFFGDETGASAILEGDITLRKEGRYQVLSNFYLSQAPPGAYPCDRYNIAVEMLENSSDISVALFRRILAATHQEGPSQTFYSNIFDLKQGIVYQYHFHNYANEIVSDPREQWAKAPLAFDLPSLFPKTYAALVYDQEFEFERNKDKIIEERRASGEIVEVNPEVFNQFVGRYQLETQGTKVIDVVRAGDRLLAKVTGRETQELFPLSKTRFLSLQARGDQRFTFEKDDTGRVTQVIVDAGNGWLLPAARLP